MSDTFNKIPPNASDKIEDGYSHLSGNGTSSNNYGQSGNNNRLHGTYSTNGRNGTTSNLNRDGEPLSGGMRSRSTENLAHHQPHSSSDYLNNGPALPMRQVVLSGSLAAFSPSSLLSLLNIQKQTGWLLLRNGAFEGYIYVEKGEVWDSGIGRVSSGALAVFQLFGWKQGDFNFEIGGLPPERRTIEASLPVLQVRATLWLDSMNKYSPIIPSPSHRIFIASEPRSEVVIEPYQWTVLTKIVTRSLSVAELATELGQDLMTVTRITAELVKMGVAVVLPPE